MAWHCGECGKVTEKTEARYTIGFNNPEVLCLDCGSVCEEIKDEE